MSNVGIPLPVDEYHSQPVAEVEVPAQFVSHLLTCAFCGRAFWGVHAGWKGWCGYNDYCCPPCERDPGWINVVYRPLPIRLGLRNF